MRLTTLPQALREKGLTVVTHGDWVNRGSPSFDPKGVVVHHTGPWSTVQGMVDLVIQGRKDLPGPLCQVLLGPDGTCHVVASGRANHAGEGSWKGLHGNSSVVGVEGMHSGTKGAPWPADQRAALSRCAAALCALIGAGSDMVCAHREWAPLRKVDPVNIDMVVFRLEVAALLAEWAPPAPPMEVLPMLDPFVVVDRVVATLKAPNGGVWMLDESGHIYGLEGAPDHDMPARHPEYWSSSYKARRLEPLGQGYRVVTATGSFYEYP